MLQRRVVPSELLDEKVSECKVLKQITNPVYVELAQLAPPTTSPSEQIIRGSRCSSSSDIKHSRSSLRSAMQSSERASSVIPAFSCRLSVSVADCLSG